MAATVQVRKQGAQIRTGGPNVFTVDDPGALAVNDNCVLNSSSSPVRAVTAIGATSVTVGAGGFTPTVDDDRITVASPLATIYSDAQGNDVIDQNANPLTTDNNGRVICYAVGGKYDILATAPGSYNLQPKLVQDFAAVGAESWRSNVYPSGSAVAWNFDTLRTLVAGDKVVRYQSAGVDLFSVDYQGGFRAAQASSVLAGGLSVAGGVAADTLSVSGTASVTGASTLTGAVSLGSTLSVTGNVLTDLTIKDKVINLTDSTPTTQLTLDGDVGGGAKITAPNHILTIESGLAQGSKTAGAIQLKTSTGQNSGDFIVTALVGGGVVWAIGNTDGRMYVGGIGALNPHVVSGGVAPENNVTAPVGSIYLRTGGGAGTTFYVKESGSGNTGWQAK